MRSRIVGCQGQMITFDFYFGLCLTLYSHTDNFSKSFQNGSLSAVSGHRRTLLTRDTINIRSGHNFQKYYHVIVKKAAEHPHIEQPSLPRNINAQTTQFCSTGKGINLLKATVVEDQYKSIYYEAIDAIVQAIMTRFDQPSFIAQCFVEQLLLKVIQGLDITIEISEIKNIYGDDINFDLQNCNC